MAGDGIQRYFLNLESVSIHLYCSICQEVFTEPQRAPCGHSYCKSCITRWLNQSKTCPEDRKPLTMKQLHYDFILANIIGDQKVACPYRTKGCEFIDKLENISMHRKGCTFNPANLPDFMKVKDSPSVFVEENDENFECPDKLPTPAKPSLRMRLFRNEAKRDALRSILDSNSSGGGSGGSSSGSSETTSNNSKNVNVWLSRNDGDDVGGKKSRIISLDDSWDD